MFAFVSAFPKSLHCTDEAQQAETVLSAVLSIYIYRYTNITVSDPNSDHRCVNARLKIPESLHESKGHTERVVPDFSAVDWKELHRALQNGYLLEAIQGTTNVNIAWLTWKSNLLTISSSIYPCVLLFTILKILTG